MTNFVDVKNQTLLWNLLMKLPNFSGSSESVFKHSIKTIYEQNVHRGILSTSELQKANKDFLSLYFRILNVNNDGDRKNSPPPEPPKLSRQNHYNETIGQNSFSLTSRDNFTEYSSSSSVGIGIKREGTSQMMQEYELLQNEYQNNNKKPTNMVLPTEHIEDKPIDNMDELMAEYIRNREEIDLMTTTTSNTNTNTKLMISDHTPQRVTLSISPLPLPLDIEELTDIQEIQDTTEKRVRWKEEKGEKEEKEEETDTEIQGANQGLKKEMQDIRDSISKLYEIVMELVGKHNPPQIEIDE